MKSKRTEVVMGYYMKEMVLSVLAFLLLLDSCTSRPSIGSNNGIIEPTITVYLIGGNGKYPTYKACYWKNGTVINLNPVGSLSSSADAITVVNGNVYVAGYYEDSLNNKYACYWKDGILINKFSFYGEVRSISIYIE